jgi:hypothetical protein
MILLWLALIGDPRLGSWCHSPGFSTFNSQYDTLRREVDVRCPFYPSHTTPTTSSNTIIFVWLMTNDLEWRTQKTNESLSQYCLLSYRWESQSLNAALYSLDGPKRMDFQIVRVIKPPLPVIY